MISYCLAALFFTLLGVVYIKGYDLVKARSPEHLPHYYLIMTTIRMLLILTVIGLYVLFTDSREDSIRFALTCIIMYAIMMVVMLSLRH